MNVSDQDSQHLLVVVVSSKLLELLDDKELLDVGSLDVEELELELDDELESVELEDVVLVVCGTQMLAQGVRLYALCDGAYSSASSLCEGPLALQASTSFGAPTVDVVVFGYHCQ